MEVGAGLVIRLESTQIKWFSWWPGREARPHEWWPKTLKSKLNLKGDSQVRVHSDQMVLMAVRQGVGPYEQWPNMLIWKLENDFRQPRGLLKRAEWQPNKRVNLISFSEDVWEMRLWRCCWWLGENHCAVTDPCESNTGYLRIFCLGLVIIIPPSYQWVVGGRERLTVNGCLSTVAGCLHTVTAGFPDPSQTHIQWTGFTTILWFRKTNKADFCIYQRYN